MKLLLSLVLLVGLNVTSAFSQGAQADQIKRRARNLADQNNARPGAAPSTPAAPAAAQRSAQPTAVAAPATPLTPQQKAAASIRSDLGLLAATNSIELRQRLSKTLLTSARGSAKPAGAITDQLVEDLAAGLASAKLAGAQMDRLAQNLEGIVNSAGMTKAQTDAIADDVKAVLEKGGASAPRAALVAGDLKRVAAELSKPAGK
jgi:hypothetical protein